MRNRRPLIPVFKAILTDFSAKSSGWKPTGFKKSELAEFVDFHRKSPKSCEFVNAGTYTCGPMLANPLSMTYSLSYSPAPPSRRNGINKQTASARADGPWSVHVNAINMAVET
jgi:hypothetical protein